MSEIDPKLDLQEAQFIPLICNRCGAYLHIPKPDQEISDMLLMTSYLRMFQGELALLERVKRLYISFPQFEAARTPSARLSWAQQGHTVAPPIEAALQKELDADPELKKFLENTFFALPGRMELIRQAISERIDKDYSAISCIECIVGYYTIDWLFFDRQ